MRYAIYFAGPVSDPLMRLGAEWLGRDPHSGASLAQPSVAGMVASRFEAQTTDPRRYGFHGTLKAPFSLKAQASEIELVAACETFASTISPFSLSSLSVSRLGRFLALTPNSPEPELKAFASACVRVFEPFRAPLSASDLERRRKSDLTPDQDKNLCDWGYPYVFDEFRFHMTLSNMLAAESDAELLQDAAEQHFESVTKRPRRVVTFGLYTEAERGAPFNIHTIFDLSGEVLPSAAAPHLEER